MIQTHSIIEGPHVLFVGANGRRTCGITVRSLEPREYCELRGILREWNLNDYLIGNYDLSFLGLSAQEVNDLRSEIRRLCKL